MRELTPDEKREDLINELAFLGNISDDLWKHHPDNPDRINVTVAYDTIQEKMKAIEADLTEL